MTYLLAIAAATLLRAVAIAAAIARATVVRLRLVAQAIAGIATSDLGQGYLIFPLLPTCLHGLLSVFPSNKRLRGTFELSF